MTFLMRGVAEVLVYQKHKLVSEAANGYSGAEIDAPLQGALYAAYSEKKPLTTESLLDALAQTVPLSTTRAEEIDALRQWSSTRAVPASAKEPAAKANSFAYH